MKRRKQQFESEAALVEAFCAGIERVNHTYRDKPDSPMRWTIYRETAGFDLLLVQDATGEQVAVEAKLTFNLKVLEQVLPGRFDLFGSRPGKGPDYRAVLVPSGGVQTDLPRIAEMLGVTVLNVYNQRWDPRDDPDYKPDPRFPIPEPEWTFRPLLPGSDSDGYGDSWHPWWPEERCDLPEYVPDVAAGVASPVVLSAWKVKAIKLLVLLDRRGYVTRADMRHLKISPTIWTGRMGFLSPGDARGQYVSCGRTPDYRVKHPRVWQEIEADLPTWAEGLVVD